MRQYNNIITHELRAPFVVFLLIVRTTSKWLTLASLTNECEYELPICLGRTIMVKVTSTHMNTIAVRDDNIAGWIVIFESIYWTRAHKQMRNTALLLFLI